MPALADIGDGVDPKHDEGYRRGYSHSVTDLLSALESVLDQRHLDKLRIWTNQVGEWRAGRSGSDDPPPIPRLHDQFQSQVRIDQPRG